jgi:hypothetical protein
VNVKLFRDLREANLERVKLWHPGFPAGEWTIADWTNAMAGEAGEACNISKKIRRIESGLKGRPDELDRGVLDDLLAEEIADVVIYADLVMAKEGLRLWPNVVAKFNKTSIEHGFPQRLLL